METTEERKARYAAEINALWDSLSMANKNYLLSYGYELLEKQKKAEAQRQPSYQVSIDERAVRFLLGLSGQGDTQE